MDALKLCYNQWVVRFEGKRIVLLVKIGEFYEGNTEYSVQALEECGCPRFVKGSPRAGFPASVFPKFESLLKAKGYVVMVMCKAESGAIYMYPPGLPNVADRRTWLSPKDKRTLAQGRF